MSYIKTIEKKILKSLDLTKKENRERWRNHVDIYVSVQEKLLNPTLMLEAAVELGLLSFFEYKKKKYPARRLLLFDSSDGVEFTAVIVSNELYEAYGENQYEWDMKAQQLDSCVYFYVEPEVMFKEAQEIAEDYLDEPFELITEIL